MQIRLLKPSQTDETVIKITSKTTSYKAVLMSDRALMKTLMDIKLF